MKLSKEKIRRELLYLLACVAFGLIVLPPIYIVVGDFLIERGIWFVEVFPSLHDLPEVYHLIFSALLGAQEERYFLPIAIFFWCLFPYAVFQILRWAFRGLRLLWARQHTI